MKILKPIMLGVLVLTVLSVVGCAGKTKIGDVLADSAKYEGEDILIKGTVGETVWLAPVEKGTYQLGDGSGTIWVITTQPPPQQGQTLSTRGRVESAFIILGRSYGTVLVETARD
jgi:hypothetical protein